jgi:5-methyltetrahydropteroyltriglutamate--homocysteine methyltransferase
LEDFWRGSLSREAFLEALEELEGLRLTTYRREVNLYPTGELSLYDPMLDLAVALGLYPVDPGDLEGYYALARGKGALPLRKWFGTNYHYLVPRLPEKPHYNPQPGWFPYPVGRGEDSGQLERLHGVSLAEGLPTLIGPYTLVRLAQNPPASPTEVQVHLEALGEAYAELLKGAPGRPVLLQEPALILDGAQEDLPHLLKLYRLLGGQFPLVLLTYYLPLRSQVVEALAGLPLRGLGLVYEPGAPLPKVSSGTALVLGVVEGLSVWRTNLLRLHKSLAPLVEAGQEVWLAPKAPLHHLPWRVAEPLPPELANRLAFAEERLRELALLKGLLQGEAQEEAQAWYTPPPTWDQSLPPPPPPRPSREVRQQAQKDLGLPPFPTTTIGSFPQTKELRSLRKRLRSGDLDHTTYWQEIQEAIRENIRLQEELGLDILVHGEPERSDMVEFFAERLEGFYTSAKGFVLSYGSRVWRPPILFAVPRRREPLVLKETLYAQSLTQRPVKAIFTGPITLAAWSYLPQGVGLGEAVLALAEALRQEVRDLAARGIRFVQVDEPALLEKMPLRREEQPSYLKLAQEAFHRVVGDLEPKVQVHQHLCYSDYAALRPFLEAMDPDVVSVEGARQDPAFLQSLKDLPLEIGPGVFDVHTPEEATVEEMLTRLQGYLNFFSPASLWVNPDCGLKTRRWEEVIPALKNMVEVAGEFREKYAVV